MKLIFTWSFLSNIMPSHLFPQPLRLATNNQTGEIKPHLVVGVGVSREGATF